MSSTAVKYPDVTVTLTGESGNAFFILATTSRALRRHGVDQSTIDEFLDEAKSGDYDHLLQTCMKWVNIQ